MKTFKQILSNLVKDESGQDLIEYALVAALIALGATVEISGVEGEEAWAQQPRSTSIAVFSFSRRKSSLDLSSSASVGLLTDSVT